MRYFIRLACGAFLLHLLGAAPVCAQAAYAGLPGAEVFAKARQLEAAGNRAAAATAYQQAYAAYMSVDDSDGMTRALAAKKAVEGGSAAAPLGAAAPPMAATATAPRPAAPLAGSTVGGRPVGLFFYISSFGFNNEHVYYFTPAGQVYVDQANFSPAGLAAVNARWRGTFAISGPRMTIKWASGAGRFRAIGNGDPTGFGCEGKFRCVGPFAAARQLAGTFEGRNAAVSVDANSLVAFRTLQLMPDGTFTRDSYAAGHAETKHAAGSGFTTDAASPAAQQAGRWCLVGWLLTLTDARGTVSSVAFPTDWDEKTGRTITFRFNGTSYRTTAR